MISPVTSLNLNKNKIHFGWNKSSYEQQEFRNNFQNTKVDTMNLIDQKASTSGNNALLYNLCASSFEDLNNKNAEELYTKSYENAIKNKSSKYAIFDSIISLQRFYDKSDKVELADSLENILEEVANNPNLKIDAANNDKDINKVAAKALVISRNVLNTDKKFSQRLFENAYPLLKDNIKENSSKINELGGDIYAKNKLYDRSNEFYYKALINTTEKNYTNKLSNKVINNFIAKGEYDTAEELVGEKISEGNFTKQDLIDYLSIRSFKNIANSNFKNLKQITDYISLLNKGDKFPINIKLSALLKRVEGDLETSSEICISEMDKLTPNDEEFVSFALILAANNYDKYNEDKVKNKDNLLQSINTYRNIIEITDATQNNDMKMEALKNLADVFYKERDYDSCEKYLKKISEEDNFDDKSCYSDILSLSGNIAFLKGNVNKALNCYLIEEEILAVNEYDNKKTCRNLSNIIKCYQKMGDDKNVNIYMQKMNNRNSLSSAALLQIGENGIKNKDFKMAEENYKKAMNAPDATIEQKAIAQTYMGVVQTKTRNLTIGLNEAYKGASKLLEIVSDKNYKNPKFINETFNILNSLGYTYYFERNDYSQASQLFQKAEDLSQKKSLYFQLTDEQKLKIKSRSAAAKYKEKDYSSSQKKYFEYLTLLTGEKPLASELNSDYATNVLNTYNTEKCREIAKSLEVYGVSNVKLSAYQIAMDAFSTALEIRKGIEGNSLNTANNYRAIARLAMIKMRQSERNEKFGMENAKVNLNKALSIYKEKLGMSSPKVKKEEKFIGDYFGFGVKSGMKYIYRFLGKKHFEQEIKDDFHLVYEDLALCE